MLRRTGRVESDIPTPRSKLSRKEQELLDTGIRLIQEQIKTLPADSSIVLRKDKLFLLPNACALDLSGLRIKTWGVELGTMKKNRLEPAHALSHVLPAEDFCRICNLHEADGSSEAYLRGETFSAECENGWCAVIIDGCAAGGGKAVDGIRC